MLFADAWWNQASRDHPDRQVVFRHMQLFEALPDEDFALNRVVSDFRFSVHNFFIGKNGTKVRAPPYRLFVYIG